MADFSGRVFLITGANGGLGRAVTRAFLGDGAAVAGVYRSGQTASEDARFHEYRADVADGAQATAAVQKVAADFGRLDGLIHLVGGFEGGAPVDETPDQRWHNMIEVNLNAAFYTMRAALKTMRTAKSGRIVAVGSRTGLEPAAGLAAYGASKAALIALVRTIALEVRDSGITANVVLPSVIDTPANRAAMPAADYARWVSPDAIARLIVFLASDAAADVSGAAIPIYGRA
jgi:NAD(P)-dependent dehydrogenase (short-subunit alcohol dehydrogenase family)